ncbi:Hypothetical predicted protein [Mytilus galloprovincialis]|uniref:PHD-type domain-containing protein n=1 Tax=Mytilus galloprovincialis TaxID=29158 RepID=A0A8B6F9B0_MYTGA|nr:Hypothetical predicted protein [Mytilus galloprovincialis]
MAASIALTKPARRVTPREVYTPSKSEMNMNYRLNERKALFKKVEATKRHFNVEIQLKRGTLVMTYSPAAYEIYKQAIYEYYDNSTTKSYTRTDKTSATDSKALRKAIVEESLSVKCKNSGDRRQQYRINMFNTTSKMDINGRSYQAFIEHDLPQIIKTIKMDGVDEINSKIMELCESVIENIDTCRTKVEIRSNNETPNMTTSPNKKTKKESRKEINTPQTTDGCAVAIYDKSSNNIINTNTSHILCPICEKNVVDGDSIECSTCNMWIHKECSYLSNKQFLKQTSNENMVYKCVLCDNLDLDCKENSMFIPEMDMDREGTYTPLDLSIDNYEEDTNIETNHVSSDNIQEQDDEDHACVNDLKTTHEHLKDISILNDETFAKSTIIETPKANSKKSDETIVKTVLVQHIPTVQEPRIVGDLQQSPNAQTSQKVRAKKAKKKDTNQQDEQIAAFKARIIILEEQNKDFSNTINILHKKRCISTAEERTNLIHPHNDEQMHSMNYRMQKLEDTVSNKLNVMDIEMQHRLHVNELNMKHLIEISELKTKIITLSQGYEQHPPVKKTLNYTNAPWAPSVQQTLNYANAPPTMQNMHGYYQNLRTPGYSNILPQTLYNQIIRPPPYVQPGFIRPAAPITTHQTITPVLPQQNINRLMHEKTTNNNMPTIPDNRCKILHP